MSEREAEAGGPAAEMEARVMVVLEARGVEAEEAAAVPLGITEAQAALDTPSSSSSAKNAFSSSIKWVSKSLHRLIRRTDSP